MSDESYKKRVYSLRGHDGGYQRQHIITVTIPAASGCVVMASINVFSFIVSFLPLCVALYWCTAGPAGGVWCGLVPLKALFPIDGKPALNGVFACEKELNLSSTFFCSIFRSTLRCGPAALVSSVWNEIRAKIFRSDGKLNRAEEKKSRSRRISLSLDRADILVESLIEALSKAGCYRHW